MAGRGGRMAKAIVIEDGFDNPFVDALASEYRWRPFDTIDYAFAQSRVPALVARWRAADGEGMFAEATKAWAAVTNIRFRETTTSHGAEWIETVFSDPGSSLVGEHHYPNNFRLGGRFNVGHFLFDGRSHGPGGQSYVAFLHEIGHGLGLDHSFGEAPFPGVTVADPEDTGDYGLNQSLYTIMGYLDVTDWVGRPPAGDYGYSATPMAFDIAAVQAMYGANMETHVGDTVHALPTLNASGTSFSCIWDAGGGDTLSAAGAQVAAVIDLRAATLENAPGGGGRLSRVNGIFGGFTIAHGVVIENAVGGFGGDTITGNAADNRLDGGFGNDKLISGAGDDWLDSGRDRDRLDAGAGDDQLRGGGGRDTMRGGSGADLFVWDDGEFGGSTPATMDRILDFRGDDCIDLSRVDARPGDGDDAFAFIASAAFSGRAGQLRYQSDGRATYLSGDLDGDRAADFTIRIDGRHDLTVADLVL